MPGQRSTLMLFLFFAYLFLQTDRKTIHFHYICNVNRTRNEQTLTFLRKRENLQNDHHRQFCAPYISSSICRKRKHCLQQGNNRFLQGCLSKRQDTRQQRVSPFRHHAAPRAQHSPRAREPDADSSAHHGSVWWRWKHARPRPWNNSPDNKAAQTARNYGNRLYEDA